MNFNNLYNTILEKSRNLELFYLCNVKDTLQNKIILLIIHFSFIFNKFKNIKSNKHQKLFDYIFSRIEMDLREIGFGDMLVNKKMKIIINKFYSILINFDEYLCKKKKIKVKIFVSLLQFTGQKNKYLHNIIKYFDSYAKRIDLISINDIYKAKI